MFFKTYLIRCKLKKIESIKNDYCRFEARVSWLIKYGVFNVDSIINKSILVKSKSMARLTVSLGTYLTHITTDNIRSKILVANDINYRNWEDHPHTVSVDNYFISIDGVYVKAEPQLVALRNALEDYNQHIGNGSNNKYLEYYATRMRGLTTEIDNITTALIRVMRGHYGL